MGEENMKNKVIIILTTVFFITFLVLASNFVNNYNINIDFEEKSGENTKIEFEKEEILKDEEEVKEMSVLKLTSENYEEEVLKNKNTILIDFYADWCAPCKMMSPVVEKIAEEHQNVSVYKVNVDEESELAIKYSVMSIPTFIIIKNGEEVNRISGALAKSELEELLK